MDSKIGFEINFIILEAIRGRCASFTVLTATVSEIFGGQTTPSIFNSSIDVLLINYTWVGRALNKLSENIYFYILTLLLFWLWCSISYGLYQNIDSG